MKKEWLNPEVKNLELEFTYDDEVEIVEEDATTLNFEKPVVIPDGCKTWKWRCLRCWATQGGFTSKDNAYNDWKQNHHCGCKTS